MKTTNCHDIINYNRTITHSIPHNHHLFNKIVPWYTIVPTGHHKFY